MKVGEMAKRAGLTVRTLHWYEEVGLLEPLERTESGHRLYTESDLHRLAQIKVLRQLGFSLDEIGECLEHPDYSLSRVLQLRIDDLRTQIERERRLCRQLETVAQQLHETKGSPIELLTQAMEAMTMFEKYYTKEQMEQLKHRREAVGEDRIKAVEAQWSELMGLVRAEMEKGTDPASESLRPLAARWKRLTQETVQGFTGGDPGLTESLKKMHSEQPKELGDFGMDAGLMSYVSKMQAQLKDN